MATNDAVAGTLEKDSGNTNSYLLRDLRRPRSVVWMVVAILPVLLPVLLLIGTGLYGLDFGYHWDEEFMLKKVKWSIQNGLYLPERFYNYPSMTYWLSLVGSGLEIIPVLQQAEQDASVSQIAVGEQTGIVTQWSETILSQANLLRVRGFFLVASALAVVWVYLLQLIWRRSWIEALLAGSLLAFSWQVAYHMRWIAPDAILMQFVALTIFLTMLVCLRPDRGRFWLRLAAIAAGLACGTKYQAGLILVPVLIAAFQTWNKNSFFRGLLPLFLEVLVIFGFSYLITTPGTVLAPLEFVRDVIFEVVHYQNGHVGHTVTAGIQHLMLNIEFFSLSFFSPFEFLAFLFFIFAIFGIYGLLVESHELAWVFLSFPALYLAMISLQRVMILRNLLVLAPFLAILTGRGIVLSWELLRNKYLRFGLATIVVLSLLANAVWLIHAAETIYNRSPERFTLEAANYIEAHPETRFFVSDRVWDDFNTLGKDQAINITRDPDDADEALFYISEGLTRAEQWPATRRDLTITWFGPSEIDFNYYGGWKGDDRILLMSMDTAREIGILVVK